MNMHGQRPGIRVACRAATLAFLLQSVAAHALPPEPTTDPTHPFAGELMSVYEWQYDIYKRGDLEALKQKVKAARGSAEEMPAWRAWFTRWSLKFLAYLMLDPREGQFAAVDVAQTGDSARLIYIKDDGEQKRFFAAILRKTNEIWFVGPIVSNTDGSTITEGLDKLRSETDEKLCSSSESEEEGANNVVARHGSDETGYRIDCREVERKRSGDA